MNIRDLLKIVAIGTALILAGFLPINSESSKHNNIEKDYTYSVQARIGCLVGDAVLEKNPGNFSAGRGYDIIFAEAFDEKLIYQPCSAFVIDKHMIGEDIWTEYLKFFNEFKDDTPLLIVDDIREWIMPPKGKFYFPSLVKSMLPELSA